MIIRLITLNVDGLHTKITTGFFQDFISKTGADVYCLQETRTSSSTIEMMKPAGYSVAVSESNNKRYGGCVTYIKEDPLATRRNSLQFMEHEGRFILLEYPGYYLLNIYLPNAGANKQRLDKKIESLEWLIRLSKLLDEKKPVIMCGDFNVAAYLYLSSEKVTTDLNEKPAISEKERSVL